MGITKEDAIGIAIKEAKAYKRELANSVLLIIYKDRQDNVIKALELEFQPHNYQHLTGLQLMRTDKETGKRTVREHRALEFYRRCTDKPYITPGEIEFENQNTIDLKMTALPYITQITKITKMAGKYDASSKEKLVADYIIGGENSCIGISKNIGNDRYYPRSCLKENIKKITEYTSQVLAIFQKPLKATGVYSKIRYVAKGVNLRSITFPDEIQKLLSLEYYDK